MRRSLLCVAVLAALGATFTPVAVARRAPLVGVEVTLGAVTTWIASEGPPVRGAYQGSTESVSGSLGSALAQILERGPGAQIPAPSGERVAGIVDRLTRVCGVPARRREHIERYHELTGWVQGPDDGYVEEVRRLPGSARITLAFVYDGVPYRLEHSVRDRRDRARFRAHERRFFGSVRCGATSRTAFPGSMPTPSPTPTATPSPTLIPSPRHTSH